MKGEPMITSSRVPHTRPSRPISGYCASKSVWRSISSSSPAAAAAAAKNPGSGAEAPGRHRFVGKWTVGDGRGHTLYFTFEENGQATNTVDNGGHGTWTYSNGEVHVSWDNGWHDAIRKVGTKYQKFAYAPGMSFNDTPDNVADAQKTNPEPI